MFSCGNLSLIPVLTDLTNHSSTATVEELITGKDAAWILTTSVIIFTMQTGFGLLESGCVNGKNEVNIMVKNALDVVFGGVTYWAIGFGLSFGADTGTNPFVGVGCFFLDADDAKMGFIYAVFIFQLSFSTTSTTIVSGAMAERTRLHAYVVFSMVNTVIYCIPAHWVWAKGGFLQSLGCIDSAGCGPVHLIGGATGLVATLMLGPRSSFKRNHRRATVPSPLKTILGMLMLWWAWLRFNSGSIFVVSIEDQWKLAVRAAVNTIVSSMSGGIIGVIISVSLSIRQCRVRYDVSTIVNGILGSLVAITGICTLCRPWESLVIGSIAALLAALTEGATSALKIDDPVGVVPVHLTCGIWGLVCVGLFLEDGQSPLSGGGLLKTGQWYLLGVQTLAAVSMLVWTIITSYLILKAIDLSIGLRLSPTEEERGCDLIEHGIKEDGYSRSVGDHYYRNDEPVVEQEEEQEESSSGVGGHGNQVVEMAPNKPPALKQQMNFFREFLLSCHKNELQIELRRTNTNSISIGVSLVSEAPPISTLVSSDPAAAVGQNGSASRDQHGDAPPGPPVNSMDSGIDIRF